MGVEETFPLWRWGCVGADNCAGIFFYFHPIFMQLCAISLIRFNNFHKKTGIFLTYLLHTKTIFREVQKFLCSPCSPYNLGAKEESWVPGLPLRLTSLFWTLNQFQYSQANQLSYRRLRCIANRCKLLDSNKGIATGKHIARYYIGHSR